MRIRNHSAAVGGLVAGAVVASLPAFAQVEEIIVTAQRRQEQSQKVPIAISAFSAAKLESSGVKSTDEVGFVTPSVQFGRQIGAMVITMRGVGTSQAGVGADPSVALYIDGFYLLDVRGSITRLNNLERVEALKGPQGTLFGRNATGGLVQFITKDPTFTPSLQASVGYGNYDTVEGSLYAAHAITKVLAADVSLTGSTQGKGWGTNFFDGRDIGKTDDVAFRTKWLYKPNENFVMKSSYDYGEHNSNIGELRQVAVGHRGFGGADHVGGFYDTNLSLYPWSRSIFWGAQNIMEYNGPWFTLRNLAQYRITVNSEDIDSDGGAFNVVDATQHQYTKYWTEEFQILSNNTGRLTWILGGYFIDYRQLYDPLFIRSSGTPLAGVLNNSYFTRSHGHSAAGYAQATYEFIEGTRFTAGYRYSTETRGFYGVRISNATGLVNQTVPNALIPSPLSAKKPSWRLALDQQVTDNVLGYVSWSYGFKSGIYAMSNTANNPGTQPESLNSVEIGLKSDLLNRRLRVNASVFNYTWKNIQLARVLAGSNIIENAAAAKVKGGELEITAAPTENLSLSASLSIVHGRYSDYPNAVCSSPVPAPGGGNTQIVCDAKGNAIVRTPPLTVGLGFDYRIPSRAGEFAISLNYLFTQGFPWEPDSRLREQAYHLLNTQVSWKLPNDPRFKLRLWAKNVTGTEYYLYQASSTTFGDNASPAPPRTFGFAIDFDLNGA